MLQYVVERESDVICLDVSESLCESKGIGMVGVSIAVVRREQGIDLGKVSECAGLGEGERNSCGL